MTNATSVKTRLNNLSKQEGKTLQDNLVSYAMERSVHQHPLTVIYYYVKNSCVLTLIALKIQIISPFIYGLFL